MFWKWSKQKCSEKSEKTIRETLIEEPMFQKQPFTGLLEVFYVSKKGFNISFFLENFPKSFCRSYFLNALEIPRRKKSPYSELFWSAFSPVFPAFGLNTERYTVSLRIQSECETLRDECAKE